MGSCETCCGPVQSVAYLTRGHGPWRSSEALNWSRGTAPLHKAKVISRPAKERSVFRETQLSSLCIRNGCFVYSFRTNVIYSLSCLMCGTRPSHRFGTSCLIAQLVNGKECKSLSSSLCISPRPPAASYVHRLSLPSAPCSQRRIPPEGS
jgi:hypothetical protein